MITKALELAGKNEIKQVELELPEIQDNELLMEVVVNSPKKIDREKTSDPEDIPYILGREFGGKVVGIGKNLEGQYKIRERIAIVLSDEDRKNSDFRYLGGCSQYAVIPESYIQAGKVISYDHSAFYYGALAVPTANALTAGMKSREGQAWGCSLEDIRKAVSLAASGVLEPAVFVTHIGGIDSEAKELLTEDSDPGQKLFYSHLSFPLTAISSFGLSDDPLMKGLHEICSGHNGLWNPEAEVYLLNHAARI